MAQLCQIEEIYIKLLGSGIISTPLECEVELANNNEILRSETRFLSILFHISLDFCNYMSRVQACAKQQPIS